MEKFKQSGDKILSYFAKKANENRHPFVCTLELTDRCQASCFFCLREEHSAAYLATDKVFELLDDLKRMGCFFLSLSGGEPLLHPDFLKIVKGARDRGFAVTVTTNAMALDQRLIEELTNLSIENFLVSFHSLNPETFSHMFSTQIDMEVVLNKILYLKSLGNNVTINAVLTRFNINEMDQFRAFFLNKGFQKEEIVFNVVHPRIDGNQEFMNDSPSEVDIENFYLSNPDLVFEQRNNSASQLCYAGRTVIAIDTKGNVHPCTLLRMPAGNIHKNRLPEIWNSGDIFHPVKEAALAKNHTDCQSCDAYTICNLCIAQNYFVNGDFLEPSPYVCKQSMIMNKVQKNNLNFGEIS